MRQDGLDRNVHRWNIEGLEHDLSHALTIRLRVERRLGEQHWVLLWGNAELIIKSVVPYFLHVIPVGHDAVLDRVLQSEDTSLALRLVTDIAVLLIHANHDARHLWAAYDGWEDSTRSIVTGKTSLAHAAAVVDDQRGDFLITHDCKIYARAIQV